MHNKLTCMKIKGSLFLLALCLIISCAPWKADLNKSGGYEVAVNNAITDYVNTSRLNRGFDSYHLLIVTNENTIGVSINGDSGKWQIGDIEVGDKRKYFPSRFEVVDGELFYWSDSTVAVSRATIDIMKKFNILDTVKYSENIIPDENGLYSEGAVHYYFCKTNYLKYKKKKSTTAIGYYKPPKLNCS